MSVPVCMCECGCDAGAGKTEQRQESEREVEVKRSPQFNIKLFVKVSGVPLYMKTLKGRRYIIFILRAPSCRAVWPQRNERRPRKLRNNDIVDRGKKKKKNKLAGSLVGHLSPDDREGKNSILAAGKCLNFMEIFDALSTFKKLLPEILTLRNFISHRRTAVAPANCIFIVN